MLIILAATLVLLSSITETLSAQPYKSAMDAFKDLTEFSDAEFQEFKNGVVKNGKTSAEVLKAKKALEDKIKTMGMKLIKLPKPAQIFVFKVLNYTIMEMEKKGSRAQKLQKAFEKLRKHKKACKNLLSSYPKLKLGKC